MARRQTYLRSSAIALTALLGAASLAACNKPAANSDNATVAQAGAGPALPLTTGEATPSAAAPPVDALPAAGPAPVVRVQNPADDYAYLDQAYDQSDAVEDAPPDYSFDYDGVNPWVWQASDDSLEFAEPVGSGYRYYYYQPGAAYPYLVRDNGYAYGFDNGQLVIVYDSAGRVLPREQIDQRAADAGRYLARAQALYSASRSAGRRSVVAANWAAAQPQIAAQRSQLAAARSSQSAWRAYDAAHGAQQASHWQADRSQRQASAQRFSNWRNANFQGPPPAPAGAARPDNGVRQAQAQPQAPNGVPARVAADQVPPGDRGAPGQQAQDQRRPAQDRPTQQAQPQRARPDQAPRQADNQRPQAPLPEQARQQADAQHRQQDQQRPLAQQQVQPRQQADAKTHQQDQPRQLAQQPDQQRLAADTQRRAQADQSRPQAQQGPRTPVQHEAVVRQAEVAPKAAPPPQPRAEPPRPAPAAKPPHPAAPRAKPEPREDKPG